MPKPRLRTALIGTGRISQEHLACLKQIPTVEVAAVCDRYASLAEMTAERFAIPAWFSDHRRMLAEVRPDVVHVTTPPLTHFSLAMDALEAGCHVLVEKPITPSPEEFLALKARSEERGLVLMEDHNFLFNEPTQRILELVRSGDFGEVSHTDVFYCAAILGPGSPFTDPDAPHGSLALRGGAISDFLPHFSYLAHAFAGPHRTVRTLWRKRDAGAGIPCDEFRALVDGERGTATLSFSAHAQPNSIWVRVYGSKMQAEANLMEPRLNLDCLRPIPAGLLPFRNGIQEAWDVARAAFRGFWWRLAARPISNHGMWELLRRFYAALHTGGAPPVSMAEMEATSRLVHDLTEEGFKF